MQERYKNLQDQQKYKLQLQGQLANDYLSVMDAKQSDILGVSQDAIASKAQYNTAMAGLG